MTDASKPIVIKVGGRFFDELLSATNATNAHPLLNAIKALKSAGRRVVLVHGGGNHVQTQLKALGFVSDKLDGLRITPDTHMPTVAGMLAGFLNKSLVAKSQALHINGVGMSLADGLLAKCEAINPALGAVGAPKENDASLIQILLDANMLPIIASIGADSHGKLYNVNADHAATCIARLIDAQLILLSDVTGVLDDKMEKIDRLTPAHAQQLISDEVITDGMIVKVQAAQDSADALNSAVVIGSWNEAQALLDDKQSFGTQIMPKPN
ncbi:acetylglutamate kinase [Ningiella sp. W23]|uniref:acetylglutamate kinase n=1 Tax=Ningiella sp. W23 TaxID=3023715 RepID=UPI0037565E57